MPPYYPICLDLKGRTCVVVGGGQVAERKATSLLDAEATVVVVSPDLTPLLAELRDSGRVGHVAREYREGDLAAAYLAIAATDDPSTNHAVAVEARRRRVLVNVVDDPAYCDFALPGVLRRGDLLVAISTGGRSPALARYVRDELEAYFTPEYAALLEVAADARTELRARGRRASGESWRRALDADFRALVRRGDLALARHELVARLVGGVVSCEATPPRAG